MSYVNTKDMWGVAMSFGTMADDWSTLDEGFMFGVWATGPWVGFTVSGSEDYEWIRGGATNNLNLQIWRHTCFSLNGKTGRFKLVENGEKLWDKITPEMVGWMSSMKSTANFVGLGCLYSLVSSLQADSWDNMSMYGSVTDGQVFGRTLEDEEMKDITSCKSDLTGDISNWQGHKWELKSPYNTTEMEVYDFEVDVCSQSQHGLVMVPHKLNYRESLHACAKISGELVSYVDRSRFDEITHFISRSGHMNSNECSASSDSDGTRRTIQVYLGGSDMDSEGLWTTLYNKTKIQYLPWGPSRPYKEGENYNCMMLESTMINTGHPHFVAETSVVSDELCSIPYCPVCLVDMEVRKMNMRGLCRDSLFNKKYIFTITDDGSLLYLGDHTSYISYHQSTKEWRWVDRKDNTSVATSQSSEDSMLIGTHVFDFSQVTKGSCTVRGQSKLVMVKLTSCGEGKFTCNDGQCVMMEERCNQISNCRDESDEDNCKMLVMKANYNKKIAPFGFDYDEQKIIPVHVNISIAVIDILSIQEVNLVYILKFRLLMEWYDYRLTYHNLKMERSGNLLAREEIEKLWIPFVLFENTENNDATKDDDDTEVTITREGNFTASSPDILEEINIFTGKDNRITFQQVYSKTFKCEYQLQLYPFDTQVLISGLTIKDKCFV